jgi:RuvB-like protein 2
VSHLQDKEDILKLRAQEESVEIPSDAVNILTRLTDQTSLRYGMQLISTANVLRERRKDKQVGEMT